MATRVIDLDGFCGHMKLFVKQKADGIFPGRAGLALVTNKRYVRATPAMGIYRKRWRIEDFFNENTFLGLDPLLGQNIVRFLGPPIDYQESRDMVKQRLRPVWMLGILERG